MNYIDFIIIGILVIYMLVGFFKGFMFSLLSLFSFSVKAIASVLLCKPFLRFTNGVCKLDVSLTNGFANHFSKSSELFDHSMNGLYQSQIDAHVSECIEATKYPGFIKSFLKNIFPVQEGSSNFSFNEVFSKTIGTFFSYVITFLIIFILVSVFVFFLKHKCKKLTANSVTVKRIDRFFGIAYGLARGAINIVVVLAVLSWFKNFSFLSGFFTALYKSSLGGYATNIIFPFMDKYLNLKEIAKWFLNLL